MLPRVKTAAGILALLLPITSWPQQQQKPDDGSATFSTDTRLVILPVTVQDKSGHLVTNLPQNAFQVYENGTLQPLKTFKREDVPVKMVVYPRQPHGLQEPKLQLDAMQRNLEWFDHWLGKNGKT